MTPTVMAEIRTGLFSARLEFSDVRRWAADDPDAERTLNVLFDPNAPEYAGPAAGTPGYAVAKAAAAHYGATLTWSAPTQRPLRPDGVY